MLVLMLRAVGVGQYATSCYVSLPLFDTCFIARVGDIGRCAGRRPFAICII